MNVQHHTGYRLHVDQVPGRVRAWSGDTAIADTIAAKVMHETRLPYAIYVPKDDVAGLGDLNPRRTFCPFKGTAVYRDLMVADRRLENAVWSYPRALPESQAIEGYIGFMPGVIDRWQAELGLPDQSADGSISGPVVDWLMRGAGRADGPAELTGALGRTLRGAGIAVARLNITIWALHPLLAGLSYVWNAATDQVTMDAARHESLEEPAFVNSPIRHVMAGLGGVRQPLTTGEMEFNFPIMDDLRSAGATDYVAMPLIFSNGRNNVLTMASDHPNGFTTANLGLVFECSSVIARHFEVHVQEQTARTLLGTFLGKRTGSRVLGGEIRRGDGEEIEAAVLFCDLRGSSRLAEEMDRPEYLHLLNCFFEAVSNAVEDAGGEVLKFIGDAVLAVFPAEDSRDSACRNAVASAIDMRDRVAAIAGPETPLQAAVGVSFGNVTYGNVGSRDRLDFTVIGEAANIAARLSDLCKTVGEAVLISGAAFDGQDLRPVGTHTLHNIAEPISVSTISD